MCAAAASQNIDCMRHSAYQTHVREESVSNAERYTQQGVGQDKTAREVTGPETMGPRMMALPWPAKPKDTTFTPSNSGGRMALVSGSMTNTGGSGFTIVGRLGPYTSASKMPTLAPIWARVYARLTAVVDLPTPGVNTQSVHSGCHGSMQSGMQHGMSMQA